MDKIKEARGFEHGKAATHPSLNSALDELTDCLNQNPSAQIIIEGHSDNVGLEKTNLNLSIDRPISAREYLIKKGIAKNRIDVKGHGSSKPLTDNSTEEGRMLNRRLELVILN